VRWDQIILGGLGYAADIRQTSDGGYIVVGKYNDGTVDARDYLYLTKLAP
jgi:hypothetical protein